jgi:hypothetical protein
VTAACRPESQEQILEAAVASLTEADIPPDEQDGWLDPDVDPPAELAALPDAELEELLAAAPPRPAPPAWPLSCRHPDGPGGAPWPAGSGSRDSVDCSAGFGNSAGFASGGTGFASGGARFGDSAGFASGGAGRARAGERISGLSLVHDTMALLWAGETRERGGTKVWPVAWLGRGARHALPSPGARRAFLACPLLPAGPASLRGPRRSKVGKASARPGTLRVRCAAD